jgi:hypothetical protein
VTCAPDNVGSRKAIEASGGVLQAVVFVQEVNRETCHYWIDVETVHLAALDLAWRRAVGDVDAGAAQRATALVKTIYEAGDSQEHRALLGRALLLLARRLGEEGDMEGACGTAQRAQEVFAQLADLASRAFAMRVRAAALLFLGRHSESVALLDGLGAHATPAFAREGAFRRIQGSEDDDWVHSLLAKAEQLRRDAAQQSARGEDDDDFERGPFV